jgi:hypothetical protein
LNAKERFEKTRDAIPRLNDIKLLLMYDCDDWKPPTTRTRTDMSDPTANRAIYNVDERAEKLEALRQEERELETLIGGTLAIISSVRVGFGEIYANLLDWHYIDGQTWTEISEEQDIPRSTCYYLRDIACDWVDSVGVSRLLKGEVNV